MSWPIPFGLPIRAKEKRLPDRQPFDTFPSLPVFYFRAFAKSSSKSIRASAKRTI